MRNPRRELVLTRDLAYGDSGMEGAATAQIETSEVIERFRKRARRLRISATISLMLILVAISGGMYLFVFAGEIASREANITLDRLSRGTETISSTMQELQPELIQTLGAFGQMSSEMRLVFNDFTGTLTAVEELVADGVIISINGPFASEAEGEVKATAEALRTEIAEVGKRLTFVLEDSQLTAASLADLTRTSTLVMNETVTLLKTLNEDMRAQIAATFGDVLENAANQSDQVQTTLLVSTLSTRVGAMLLIIFLVQILVNLYRYNTRLASFYEGRADALEIAPSPAASGFTELIHAISPDNLDFGKTPASPAEHAVTLAREVLARQGR
ncbi:hypothetical protein Q5Y75_01000 [Ruegeria sp. 2205SS24-7]|uniref:hypothetical protein n=1 Tax=Ruegeria discodermiae TaxID=3064389 RepID=UPI002740B260|nr:hypothetical protein [Ruegeria sp. 2205SS24-7]MDP5215784.1 hypothetical protein [Ruegeria sp. 2205SS24-7]